MIEVRLYERPMVDVTLPMFKPSAEIRGGLFALISDEKFRLFNDQCAPPPNCRPIQETRMLRCASRRSWPFSLWLGGGGAQLPFLAQADILVSNTNSSGAGSLADAITQANAAPGSTITFAISEQHHHAYSPLPAINASVTINGGTGNTVSGNNAVQVFFVNTGTVAINNLTIANGKAAGGAGGNGYAGGGGSAGLGGGLLVNSTANVTLSGVSFASNTAIGGAAARRQRRKRGGGGGGWRGGGGSASFGGTGGNGGSFGGGAAAPVDASGGDPGGAGGAGAGGGGGGGGRGCHRRLRRHGRFRWWRGWRRPSGCLTEAVVAEVSVAAVAATVGSATAAWPLAVLAAAMVVMVAGLAQEAVGARGLGGAIFVVAGGSLTMGSGVVSGNTVVFGAGGGVPSGSGIGANGNAYGSGFFLNGSGTLNFAPTAGTTLTISDDIADQTGNGGTGANAGSWGINHNGAGTTILSGANTYSGVTTINAGTLQFAKQTALYNNILCELDRQQHRRRFGRYRGFQRRRRR